MRVDRLIVLHTCKSISQSISQAVSQSVNQSVNQSISQPVSQSVSQSVSHPVNPLASVSRQTNELFYIRRSWGRSTRLGSRFQSQGNVRRRCCIDRRHICNDADTCNHSRTLGNLPQQQIRRLFSIT